MKNQYIILYWDNNDMEYNTVGWFHPMNYETALSEFKRRKNDHAKVKMLKIVEQSSDEIPNNN